ncbi:MAG: GAF domain-containing protein [Ketobacter sp.]|nr:MAG: GAF domain-containing protein [Ketobacter sp.]
MKPAPYPDNEAERLQALEQYKVLDTDPEQGFDAIVRLVAYICDVPIALVSLVDDDRQWFKAKVGLDTVETSRDLAFCAYAIHQDAPFIVEDASRDERFDRNPLVTGDPGIRFYAGAPLRTPSGFRIGTLCAIDTQPRKLSGDQIDALRTLAGHVVDLFELRLKYAEALTMNEELVQQQEKIIALSEQRKRFMANLNHEMRTPLNAIMGFSNMLRQRVQGLPVPEYVQDGLSLIQLSSKHLFNLISDVLDLSKMEAGKMDVVALPFNPNTLLSEILLINTEQAMENKIALHLHVDDSVPSSLMGDERKISQVLLNVISNAIKYTPEEKTVNISAEYTSGWLDVVVKDEGIGIDKEHLDRIFDEFEQIPNTLSGRSKGTGLGLSIVKKLVSVLGGQVNVKSELEQGTVFSLRFPLPVAAENT